MSRVSIQGVFSMMPLRFRYQKTHPTSTIAPKISTIHWKDW